MDGNRRYALPIRQLMVELNGGSLVSSRQTQVAELAAEGLTDKEIGKRLGLSASTLRTYWDRLRERMQARSRTEVVARLCAERIDRMGRERDQLVEVIKSLPMFVWTAEPSGRVDFCNDWFGRMGGLRPEDAIGRGCRALMLEEDLPSGSLQWKNAQETGEPYEAPVRFRCSDGTVRWHHIRLFPLRTGSGAIYLWIGTGNEIQLLNGEDGRPILAIDSEPVATRSL